MIRPLLTAALLATAPIANAVTIVIVRPVIIVVRPTVTIAPVSHSTVTAPAPHISEPEPVTRVVTPTVTPAIVPLPAYTPPRSIDSCAIERKMRGDCFTM